MTKTSEAVRNNEQDALASYGGVWVDGDTVDPAGTRTLVGMLAKTQDFATVDIGYIHVYNFLVFITSRYDFNDDHLGCIIDMLEHSSAEDTVAYIAKDIAADGSTQLNEPDQSRLSDIVGQVQNSGISVEAILMTLVYVNSVDATWSQKPICPSDRVEISVFVLDLY